MPVPILIEIPDRIDTPRLVMRPPHAGDGAVLFEAISEALVELRLFLASLPWVATEQSAEASEIYCRNAHANFIARRDMPYLLFERDTSLLIGSAGLHRPDWSTPKLEVGYWCRTSCTGKGFISEAVSALVQLALVQLSVARVELVTDEENAPSRRVAERCGFVLEGTLRSERRAPDGTLRNTCIYARTTNAA